MAVGEKPVRTHNKPNSSPGAGAESRPQQGPSRLGRALAAVRQRAAGPPGQLGEHVQGLWTRSKPLTKPDQRLLDRSAILTVLLSWSACVHGCTEPQLSACLYLATDLTG